jgi:hypothetical protein
MKLSATFYFAADKLIVTTQDLDSPLAPTKLEADAPALLERLPVLAESLPIDEVEGHLTQAAERAGVRITFEQVGTMQPLAASEMGTEAQAQNETEPTALGRFFALADPLSAWLGRACKRGKPCGGTCIPPEKKCRSDSKEKTGQETPPVRNDLTKKKTWEELRADLENEVKAAPPVDYSYTPKGKRDAEQYLSATRLQGFTKLPKNVTVEELDQAIKDGGFEVQKAFRHDFTRDKKAEANADQMRHGELRASSRFGFGQGIYFRSGHVGNTYDRALLEYGSMSVRGCLEKGSHGIELKTLRNQHNRDGKKPKDEAMRKWIRDLDVGVYAALKGYQFFTVPNKEFVVVLDRSILRLQNENLR